MMKQLFWLAVFGLGFLLGFAESPLALVIGMTLLTTALLRLFPANP